MPSPFYLLYVALILFIINFSRSRPHSCLRQNATFDQIHGLLDLVVQNGLDRKLEWERIAPFSVAVIDFFFVFVWKMVCVENTHYLKTNADYFREKSSSYLLSASLRRKLQLFALQHLGNVEVEEVAVQDRLDGSGEDRNQVVVSLGVVPVDPVEQIQGTVGTQRKQVMTGNAFRFARFADQEQLRQDGHRLQVDGERPQNLQWSEAGVNQKRQHEAR